MDGKIINVCKLEEIEARKNEVPKPRPVERDVDMASLNAAREAAARKREDIKLRDAPKWLPSTAGSAEAGERARATLRLR